MNKTKLQESGFTIVELMIALSVLSTILLISSVVMINIGKLYSKGVNMANLQNATRTVSQDITESIQFGSNDPTPITSATFRGIQVKAFCVGSVRYTFALNRALGDDNSVPQTTYHVLWRDIRTNTSNCKPLDISDIAVTVPVTVPVTAPTSPGSGYEMMPEKTRLTRLNVAETPAGTGLFKLDIYAAYGDTDLMKSVVVNSTVPEVDQKTICKGSAGSQFCATSNVSSVVTRRVQ